MIGLAHRVRNGAIARRLAGGAGANFMGKFWVIVFQLISVPVLTTTWGVEGFGVWLMISTIPAYLAISDFGLATAAGNDITRAIARQDFTAALRSFQTVWLFITAVSLAVAAVVLAGLFIWVSRAAEFGGIAMAQIGWAGALVTVGAVLGAQKNVVTTLYHATHKYALGHFLMGISFALQGLAVIAAALAGGGIVHAAAASCAVSGGMLALMLRIILRRERWCRLGRAQANRGSLRQLMRPSLAALALTVANSLGLHAAVVAIGWTAGPTAAAVFATARMISRAPLQFAGLVTRASIPELTRAIEAGNTPLTQRLMRANMASSAIVMAPALVILLIWGGDILRWLSKGAMQGDAALFALLGGAALFQVVWSTLSAPLLAMNRQGEYAWLVLALSAIVTCAALVPSSTAHLVAAAMLMAEAGAAVWVWRLHATAK